MSSSSIVLSLKITPNFFCSLQMADTSYKLIFSLYASKDEFKQNVANQLVAALVKKKNYKTLNDFFKNALFACTM